MSLYEIPITKLSGIGEKRAALFRKLGIETVGNMISFYPRDYECWSDVTPIADAVPGERCVVRARVATPVNQTRLPGGRLMCKLRIGDDTGFLNLVYFNNRYISSMLRFGEEYLFMGKVAYDRYGRQMVSPEHRVAADADAITPIYNLTAGLNNHIMVRAAKEALSMLPDVLRDPLPYDILNRYQLCPLSYALQNIHFPSDMQAMEKARRRLVFEELLTLNLGMRMMKSRSQEDTAIHMPTDFTPEFVERLPFTLTGAQQRAVSECVADMRDKPSPMNRLIQGDVGSGKTAVCAALCYHTVRNGYQAAFMAPTEILAQQHFENFEKMFADTGMHIELLTGSMTAAEKRHARERIESGESDIVIGTHALLSESTVFRSLGCAITDEQHRFGVAQRARLASKGDHPHVLVLSATPIPRTLGLIIYGDLDITIIDELPPGRTPIETYFIGTDKRDRALGFVKKQVDEGRQAYIVCPLVEEGEGDLELQNANDYAAELMLGVFKDYPVGILHGKMKAKEKEKVMAQFASGEIAILVSTTVVEVGVDVKNATVMMVENADRFGLSTLHQLRGRVGRGKHKSYCILVSDHKGENTEQRLTTMCRTENGFEIADMDLKMRGPGDFFGNRQHGLPQLSIADFSDTETLAQSQEAAEFLLKISPDLSDDAMRLLRAKIKQLFRTTENTMN